MNPNKYIIIIAMMFIFLSGVAMPTIYAADESQTNEVLKLVNAERTNNGLAPLTLDSELVSAADIRSKELNILFSHTRPDGRDYTTVLSKATGENIAKGQTTPAQVMNSWMNSAGHKANILNPNYKSIGIGYYKANDGTTYWVQLFSKNKADETPKNPTKVEGLAISSVNTNKITLKWNSPSPTNAKGYQIFRYNPKTKTYSLIKTISGSNINSFTNTGLTSVTSYSYKVKSYLNVDGKTYYGPYSSVVKTTTKPATPSLKLSSGKKKATVSWNKVSKSNGYQIYISTNKNGKYSLKKTITSGSTLKFIDKNLKSKAYYYYKIRSYSLVNNSKIYSNFSPVKSIKNN